MFSDLRTVHYLVILVCLTILAGSCGSGEFLTPPIVPPSLAQPRAAAGPQHQCWGLYDIFISADRSQWDVVPRRAGMAHLNILPLLEGSDPPNLFIPEDGIVFEEDYIAATVAITHPLESIPGVFDASFFRGFDVKGIVMFPGSLEFPTLGVTTQDPNGLDGQVLNAEGYTRWWNPTEFAEGDFLQTYVEGKMGLFPGGSSLINATVHPYRWIYPTGIARHSFPPGETAQTTYHLLLPEPGEPFALMYAIDASHMAPTEKKPDDPDPDFGVRDFAMTANQAEPYDVIFSKITNGMWGDGLFEGGGQCTLEIDVFDWQDSRFLGKTPNTSQGLRKPLIEAPDFFDETLKFSYMASNVNSAPHATAAVEVTTGHLPADFLIINDTVIDLPETLGTNTSFENATDIADAINSFTEADVYVGVIEDGTLGYLTIEHVFAGQIPKIEIEETASLVALGLNTLDNAVYEPGTPGIYTIDNGSDSTKWTVTFSNEKTILPGWYTIMISTPDYFEDPIFPTESMYTEAYWILQLEVAEWVPNICDDKPGVHNSYMGGGIVTNAASEYRADCDFIGYEMSPYKGRLLFNKVTDFNPGGVQEICVMDVDTPKVAAALKIITLDSTKRGIPLILQEDGFSGNIILVNHQDQDEVFVFNYAGNLLKTWDYGDGDDGFNSPIAIEFDDSGGMWVISHRGVAGPELRHWIHTGGGNYVNVQSDYLDLAPAFGTGYNIVDLALLPSENFLLIFSNKNNGHVEFFDTSVSPPVIVEDLTMVGLFGSGITPVQYPGLRIAGGGALFIDLVDAELARCRIVAVANVTTGPLAMQKFDFFANKLGVSYLPSAVGELSLALNNDPQMYKRRVVSFPIAQNNAFNVWDIPPDW